MPLSSTSFAPSRRVPQQRAHDVDAGDAVFNPGRSGISSGAASLQAGRGSPAPPQAFGPSQGRSGWFSQHQCVPSQRAHVTSGLRQCFLGSSSIACP